MICENHRRKTPARKKYRVGSPSGLAANNAIFFAGGFGEVADGGEIAENRCVNE